MAYAKATIEIFFEHDEANPIPSAGEAQIAKAAS